MNCADFEILLCDHLDGVLPEARKAEFELHLAECSACAELARDVQAATGFLAKVPAVEPPPELLTKIVFELPAAHHARAKKPGALRRLVNEWLQPVMQPRFAMGAAMTILSFSLLARFTGFNPGQIKAEDLQPAKVWRAVDDKVYRSWQRTVKFYENIRVVYEIQAQLREWTQSDQEARNRAADRQTPSAPPAAAPANPGQAIQKEAKPDSTGTPNAPLRNEKQEK